GVLAPAGQAYATMSASVGGANYTAANGQLLSGLGTVIPVTLGPTNDLFFLSFDQLGSHVHAYVEPTVAVSPPAPDPTPRPDFGGEVDSLLTRIPTLNAGATVSQATVAACTAVLGSAAVTLQ